MKYWKPMIAKPYQHPRYTRYATNDDMEGFVPEPDSGDPVILSVRVNDDENDDRLYIHDLDSFIAVLTELRDITRPISTADVVDLEA